MACPIDGAEGWTCRRTGRKGRSLSSAMQQSSHHKQHLWWLLPISAHWHASYARCTLPHEGGLHGLRFTRLSALTPLPCLSTVPQQPARQGESEGHCYHSAAIKPACAHCIEHAWQACHWHGLWAQGRRTTVGEEGGLGRHEKEHEPRQVGGGRQALWVTAIWAISAKGACLAPCTCSRASLSPWPCWPLGGLISLPVAPCLSYSLLPSLACLPTNLPPAGATSLRTPVANKQTCTLCVGHGGGIPAAPGGTHRCAASLSSLSRYTFESLRQVRADSVKRSGLAWRKYERHIGAGRRIMSQRWKAR